MQRDICRLLFGQESFTKMQVLLGVVNHDTHIISFDEYQNFSFYLLSHFSRLIMTRTATSWFSGPFGGTLQGKLLVESVHGFIE
jgi:hypothetical protein